jgi:hypothetical protein
MRMGIASYWVGQENPQINQGRKSLLDFRIWKFLFLVLTLFKLAKQDGFSFF